MYKLILLTKKALFVVLCCTMLPAIAQKKPQQRIGSASSAAKPKGGLALVARPYKDSVALRWAPSDYATFLDGCQYGYTVFRAMVEQGKRTGDWKEVSDQPIKPITEDEFYALYSKDEIAQKAMFIVLADNTIDRTVKEAVDKAADRKFGMVMGLVAADLHPKVAKLSGLYFVDKNVTTGRTYQYEVRLHRPTKADVLASCVATPSQTYLLPELGEVIGKRKRKVAQLRWRKDQLPFVYYNIYRSSVSEGPFEKVNKLPYVNATSSGQDQSYAAFEDTATKSDQHYYYRIKGVNVFGDESPLSAIVHVHPSQSIFATAVITDIGTLDNQSVMLAWEMKDPQSLKNLVGYYVQRTRDPLSHRYETLNKQPLKSTTFRDANPINSGIYRILTVGTAKDTTYSSHRLFQLRDSIPPATPRLLEALADTNNRIHIRWRANHEPDLQGYRIFKGYGSKDKFSRLTKESISDTLFTDTISKNLTYKKIYYKLIAVDQHDNPSTFSEPFEVKLIDRTPPKPPVVASQRVSLGKVTLEWVPSTSTDVVKTVLLRKPKYEYDWQTLLTLKDKEVVSITSFVDTTVQPNTEYYYLLQATDDGGLQSFTEEMVTVKTARERYKPSVQVFKALAAPANNFIKISWAYSEQGVQRFVLYRKTLEGALQQIATLSGTAREYYDKQVVPSSEYHYFIQAHFADFGESKMEGPVVIHY